MVNVAINEYPKIVILYAFYELLDKYNVMLDIINDTYVFRCNESEDFEADLNKSLINHNLHYIIRQKMQPEFNKVFTEVI